MKAVYKIIGVVLLCALFIGGAGASNGFTVSEPGVVTPSGILEVGDLVTATVTLSVDSNDGTIISENLELQSDLTNVAWDIITKRGKNEGLIGKMGSDVTVGGMAFPYYEPFYFYITMTGSVPESEVGHSIIPMKVELKSGTNVKSSYSTPEQYVYNTADFPSDVAARKAAIAAKQNVVNSFTGKGVDTSDSTFYLNKASEEVAKAETYGTANLNSALECLNYADSLIVQAQEALNSDILTFVSEQMAVLNSDVSTLNSMGQVDKATLLSVSANSLAMMYNNAVSQFETDKTQDLSSLYSTTLSMKEVAANYIAAAQAEIAAKAAAQASSQPTTQPTSAVVVPTSSVVVSTMTPTVSPTHAVNPTVQPTQSYAATSHPTAYVTGYPTQSQPVTYGLNGVTQLLIIIIVVLGVGLIIAVLLLRNSKNKNADSQSRSNKDKGKNKGKNKGKDKWESL